MYQTTQTKASPEQKWMEDKRTEIWRRFRLDISEDIMDIIISDYKKEVLVNETKIRVRKQ